MPGKAKSQSKYGFGKKSSGAAGVDLILPSTNDAGKHNVCLVRVPNPQNLIALGVLDSFDSLTALVKTEHFDRVAVAQAADPDAELEKIRAGVQALVKNQDQIMAGLELMDKVVAHCVLQPKVFLPKEDPDDWKPEELAALSSGDAVLVGDIDLTDKMFILQFEVGGTSDLEEFRKGTEQLMGSVAGGSDVPVPAKRVPARRAPGNGDVPRSSGTGVRKSSGARTRSG